LDSVRTVCFHPNEMIAASGSDDGTVKIWNLQRTTGKDGSAIKK
jgi:striatin 1/3/4